MKNSINLRVQHKCTGCELKKSGFFCNFPEPAMMAFEAMKITTSYPKGAALFVEGEPTNGIYMVCQGKVKLSTHSADGKALILRVTEPGEVLGLSSTIAGQPHVATAEVIENCQINFVRKQDLLRFLREYADAGLNALKQLSENYHQAYTQVCSLGLSSSVADKLAKLLMNWCSEKALATNSKLNGSPIRLKLSYSHEEIAEMIGTSRETVTRMLKDFRERGLITLKGSDLIVPSYNDLERTIGTRGRSRAIL